MPRKKPYIPKPFESTINNKIKGNIFVAIYYPMMVTEAWRSLTKNQRLLYMYCKMQYYLQPKKKKPKPEFKILNDDEKSRCFFMNKNLWCNEYNLYSANNARDFIKDMRALIDRGFIKLIQEGKNTRTKNIYMLHDGWRYWHDTSKDPNPKPNPP